MLQNKLISSLKKELEINKGLADIVIFGSAARTNFQKYNDIDLLIVFKNSVSSLNRAIIIENLEALHGINIAPLVKFSNPDNPFIKPILNYGPGLTLNYGPRMPDSRYHTFYCKEKDLDLKDILGVKFVQEKISLRELT